MTRSLKGPSDFDAWKACWEVFRAAMISLMCVCPATLDSYERGIAELVRMFPTNWGIISCADEIVRSEIWSSTAEGLHDSKAWPADQPWDLVIRMTTYGGTDSTTTMGHWWFIHAVAACQRAGSAIAYLQDVEGTKLLPMPDGMYQGSSSSTSTRRPQNKRQRNHTYGSDKPNNTYQAPPQRGTQPPWAEKSSGGGGKGKGKKVDNKGKGKKHGGGKSSKGAPSK